MADCLRTAYCRGAQACASLAAWLAVTPHRQEHHPKQAGALVRRCAALVMDKEKIQAGQIGYEVQSVGKILVGVLMCVDDNNSISRLV
jgi:hypothetical protein